MSTVSLRPTPSSGEHSDTRCFYLYMYVVKLRHTFLFMYTHIHTLTRTHTHTLIVHKVVTVLHHFTIMTNECYKVSSGLLLSILFITNRVLPRPIELRVLLHHSKTLISNTLLFLGENPTILRPGNRLRVCIYMYMYV